MGEQLHWEDIDLPPPDQAEIPEPIEPSLAVAQ